MSSPPRMNPEASLSPHKKLSASAKKVPFSVFLPVNLFLSSDDVVVVVVVVLEVVTSVVASV